MIAVHAVNQLKSASARVGRWLRRLGRARPAFAPSGQVGSHNCERAQRVSHASRLRASRDGAPRRSGDRRGPASEPVGGPAGRSPPVSFLRDR
jgi:hypothetical protein